MTTDPPANERLIEWGWLVPHDLEPPERRALEAARTRVIESLSAWFPEFEWRLPVVERADRLPGPAAEPVALLDEAVRERTARHWDFATLVTRADLRSYYKPFALATPSRAVSAAVVSMARLRPAAGAAALSEAQIDQLSQRLYGLALHLLGDLNGLPHRDEPDAFMFPPQEAADLEAMAAFDGDEREALADELAETADVRLEESPRRARGTIPFYLRATWIGLDDIASGVYQAQPWLFPLRSSRLTTAGVSAAVILVMTAEVWELGMSQRAWVVAVLSAAALAGTSAYILMHQRLLLRRARRNLTEQEVFTNVTITTVVLLGMLTTYALLFVFAALFGLLFYGGDLVRGWAASVEGPIGTGHRLALAGFIASLGIVIGALGASFEGQHYFRHLTYIDEET